MRRRWRNIEIKSIEKLELADNDIIVLKFDYELKAGEADKLAAQLRDVVDQAGIKNSVLVLDKGSTIKIIKPCK